MKVKQVVPPQSHEDVLMDIGGREFWFARSLNGEWWTSFGPNTGLILDQIEAAYQEFKRSRV